MRLIFQYDLHSTHITEYDSLISDGESAILITNSDNAKKTNKKYVEMSALSHVTDFMELRKRPTHEFTGAISAVNNVYEKTGLSVNDLDFVEVHDCQLLNC